MGKQWGPRTMGTPGFLGPLYSRWWVAFLEGERANSCFKVNHPSTEKPRAWVGFKLRTEPTVTLPVHHRYTSCVRPWWDIRIYVPSQAHTDLASFPSYSTFPTLPSFPTLTLPTLPRPPTCPPGAERRCNWEQIFNYQTCECVTSIVSVM